MKMSPTKRHAIRKKSGGRCWYCGEPLAEKNYLTCVDHVAPRSRGGTGKIENLVIACRSCNTSKGALDTNYLRDALRLRQAPWTAKFTVRQILALEEIGIQLPIPPAPPFWFEIRDWLEARAQ